MICFYHKSDFDGKCSGHIVSLKYPDVNLVPIDYGDDYNLDNIPFGETVCIVDFSFPPEEMYKLSKHCNLIWIDHHKTAIENSRIPEHNYDKLCSGIRKDGIAACQLCWEYFFPKENIPEYVMLLAKYDIWDINYNNNVIPFQFGLELEETDIRYVDNIFTILSNQEKTGTKQKLYEIIDAGFIINKYEKEKNKKICSSSIFKVNIEGFNLLALNNATGDSNIFESVSSQEHDGFLLFRRKKNNWTITFYTDKKNIDVSEIAKKFGGGGHRKAAGCVVPIGKLKEILGIE